jgi:hypothetical protein
MKLILNCLLLFILLPATSIRAASDADVTLLKVEKVAIEEDVITIVVAEAKTRITLIRDDHDPSFSGHTWNGMPVSRVQVVSNKAIFTIQRRADAAPGGPLANAWQESLKSAKELKDGKEVGRIGFYAPDIVIKGNMIDAITGFGFLFAKGQ